MRLRLILLLHRRARYAHLHISVVLMTGDAFGGDLEESARSIREAHIMCARPCSHRARP
jgi:hypothetical protein